MNVARDRDATSAADWVRGAEARGLHSRTDHPISRPGSCAFIASQHAPLRRPMSYVLPSLPLAISRSSLRSFRVLADVAPAPVGPRPRPRSQVLAGSTAISGRYGDLACTDAAARG